MSTSYKDTSAISPLWCKWMQSEKASNEFLQKQSIVNAGNTLIKAIDKNKNVL